MRKIVALQQHLCILILLAATASSSGRVMGVYEFEFKIDGADFDLQPGNQLSWKNDGLWLTPDPEISNTAAQNNAVGRVVHNRALPLFKESSSSPGQLDVVSFNTSFNFKIVTPCGYGDCGDGLAFSISALPELLNGSMGGSLGVVLYNSTTHTVSPDRNLFVVEFDTFKNDAFFDPSSSHIGIDFNGITSNYTLDTSNATAHPDLYLYSNYSIFAWVEYIAPLHQILVFATNSSQRPSKPSLNATYDLSTLFDRNQELYAAISAASGRLVQGNVLFSWTFTSEDANTTSPPVSSPPPLVLPLTLSLSGVLLLAAACGLLALVYKRRKHMFNPAMIEMIPSDGSVPRHSYRELKKATDGFSNKQKVGVGGFSSVYKGTLSTGDVVAVKRLKEGLRMEVDFASEIQIISQIRHRNLLQLRGWGYERGEALLVYQYMPNGSLDSYLFAKNRGQPALLDGDKRFNILVGVAAALEYLHEGLGECVIHRDVKAANVMLTESFEAMLGDFGLARLITHNQAVTMTAAGTPGYVAPEVVYTGRATNKADVYSFGMLALEVACGRRALDESLPPEEMHLVDWIWLLQQSGKLMDALDPACHHPSVIEQQHHQHIQAEVANYTDDSAGKIVQKPLIAQKPEDHMAKDWYNLQELKWQCVIHVALLCCSPWPEDRPTMRQVHQTLLESLVLPLPSTRPTYSRPSINFFVNSSSSSTFGQSSISLSTPPSSKNVFSL